VQGIDSHEVTVAICVRNGEKYIEDAILSAEKQSAAAVQILVIDDGSEDDSASIAEKRGCTVIRQEPIGLGGARNTAFRAAVTPWIYFLDADDLMSEDALKNLLAVVKSDVSAVGAYGFRQNFISPELIESISLVDAKFLEAEKSLIPSGSLWKTNLGILHKFNEESIVADIEWIGRLREEHYHLAEAQEIVVFRRIHLNNTSSTRAAKRAYLDLAIRNIREEVQTGE
jgi:glycosyltransferase involved in cell wall biosynthesis